MDMTGALCLVGVSGHVATYRLTQAVPPRVAMLLAVGRVTDAHREIVVVDADGRYVAGARG